MTSQEYVITGLNANDFDEWSILFRGYIDFYNATIPEEQYQKTFDRIIEGKKGLHALVVREQGETQGKIVGIAHFFKMQTPWSERDHMMLNDLFVDPSIRGKGLGKRLTQAVAQAAKEADCSRLQWVTKHDNVTARKMYDSLGSSEFVQYRMPLD